MYLVKQMYTPAAKTRTLDRVYASYSWDLLEIFRHNFLHNFLDVEAVEWYFEKASSSSETQLFLWCLSCSTTTTETPFDSSHFWTLQKVLKKDPKKCPKSVKTKCPTRSVIKLSHHRDSFWQQPLLNLFLKSVPKSVKKYPKKGQKNKQKCV